MGKILTDRIIENLFEKETPEQKKQTIKAEGLINYVLAKSAYLPIKLGVNIIYAGAYVSFAALIGEAMDNTPYVNEAVPKGIQIIFKNSYFYDNLDKLGAALGFIEFFWHSRHNRGIF